MPPKPEPPTQDEESQSAKAQQQQQPQLVVDGIAYPLIDIRATGDILLDVKFENTNACNKSIPPETIRQLRTAKAPVLSARIFYRVRLETLKKQSHYFAHLLGPVFAEGRAVEEVHRSLVASGRNPTEVVAEELPRISIVDEDGATRTLGREVVFRDMLRVIHGAVRIFPFSRSQDV